jgi:hypothetical protein
MAVQDRTSHGAKFRAAKVVAAAGAAKAGASNSSSCPAEGRRATEEIYTLSLRCWSNSGVLLRFRSLANKFNSIHKRAGMTETNKRY